MVTFDMRTRGSESTSLSLTFFALVSRHLCSSVILLTWSGNSTLRCMSFAVAGAGSLLLSLKTPLGVKLEMRGPFSRKELYDLVWSKPVSKCAPEFGISGVALSKTCRKHGIPLPPRGYWARLAARRPVSRLPLPDRALGMPRTIELDREHRWGRPVPSNPDEIDIPEPVVFREPEKDLVERVRGMVGSVTVPKNLNKAHHSVRRLLEADAERREERAKSKHSWSANAELFASPFEKRRLRLLNAIFQSLGRCGVRVTVRGKDPESFEFRVGDQHLSFYLDHPGIRRYGSRWGEEAKRPASLPLELQLERWRQKGDPLRRVWKDGPGNKLERQLTEIVVALIVAGEMHYRSCEVAWRERLIEHKERLYREAKKTAEEARRREEEEQAQREKEAIDRLMREAENYAKANQIRSYVKSVKQYVGEPDAAFSSEQVEAWSLRAIEQADRIDPVLSGAFLADGKGGDD